MQKITVEHIRSFKGREPLPVLTAYDYPMAKMLDELQMPMMLVGDSLGMVVLGYPDTTQVTMGDMLHHVSAVARAEPAGVIVADLPYGSYETITDAVSNSKRLIEAGADAVKAEGAGRIRRQIAAIIAEGIPFMGHLGMLPQHIKEEGRYRIKGKIDTERDWLIAEAKLLEVLGVFAVVLELVQGDVAEKITREIRPLTIGIGAGNRCDGQILVTHDLVGQFPWFTPRFVTPRCESIGTMKGAIASWQDDVRQSGAKHEI